MQVNVLGRALPLLYGEAVNLDSSVGSIIHMVIGDLSAEENQIFIDTNAFETTTLAAIRTIAGQRSGSARPLASARLLWPQPSRKGGG